MNDRAGACFDDRNRDAAVIRLKNLRHTYFFTEKADFHNSGGSYGQCQWPGEVDKGHKMPGRMGNARRTIQNLKIVKILEKKNLLLIKGSLPGAKGATVLICSAKKVSP